MWVDILTLDILSYKSVVSGSEEPDTIILQRTPDEEVRIKDKKVGLKQRKIVLAGKLFIPSSLYI